MKIFGIAIIVIWSSVLIGQDIQGFNFIAIQILTVRLGEQSDNSFEDMKSPLTITFKDSVLSGRFADGRDWGKYKVKKFFLKNEKKRSEKEITKDYNLIVEGKEGDEVWIYEIRESYGQVYHELQVPLIISSGQYFSYIYYAD
jgi:hypothetical protein